MDAWNDSRAANERATGRLSGHLSIQVAVEDAAPDCAKARNADRVSVELDAGLRQRGASAVSVHILDLSTHGFRIETHLELSVGTDVWLRLPGLEPNLARVKWTDGSVTGCAFERPLHPAVLDMIVRRTEGG